jgi:hypothetical protein
MLEFSKEKEEEKRQVFGFLSVLVCEEAYE